MSRRFTFSKTTPYGETFTAVEFDSFDEAIKAVEKGVYERDLVVGPRAAGLLGKMAPEDVPKMPAGEIKKIK